MEKGSKLLTLLAIMGGIILGISVNSTLSMRQITY